MEILYEDSDIIVVNKESGLPVQAGSASQKDLISILKNHLREEAEKNSPGDPYLGIVHRLDQPVEGIVVFAKNNKAAGELSRQVQAKTVSGESAQTRNNGKSRNGKDGRNSRGSRNSRDIRASHSDMRKVYQAVVLLSDKASYEKVKKAEHSVVVLQDYLKRNYQKNTTEIVPEGTRDAKWAELTFRTLKIWKAEEQASSPEICDKDTLGTISPDICGKDFPGVSGREIRGIYGKALLEIHLHTGRHHQIRVQLAGAGLPLDGDRKYGPAGFFYNYNLKLCASFLQFRHPATHRKMQFTVTPSFLKKQDNSPDD